MNFFVRSFLKVFFVQLNHWQYLIHSSTLQTFFYQFMNADDIVVFLVKGRGSAPCCLGGLGGPQWGLLQISFPYDSLRNAQITFAIENNTFSKLLRLISNSYLQTKVLRIPL